MAGTVGSARAPSPLAVCQVYLLPAFQIRVARRSVEPPGNSPTSHAPPLQPRHPQRIERSETRSVDGEELFAFLDDVYIVSSPERTRHLYNLVEEKSWSVAGIQLHTEKTRCWNQSGRCPPDMVDLGPEVWSPQGVKVLGTPIGSFEFIKEVSDRRLEEEQRLWDAIPWIPDLQCAWQVLPQCAGLDATIF